jgi:Bacterial extracellular solute-binding proteins, family 3
MIRCAGESVHGRNLAAFAPRDTMEEAGSKETHHGRERYMRTKLSLVSIFAAIAAVVMLEAAPAAAESTWDQIKRTGQLRYGAIDYPPNWYRDKTSGKWTGFLVEMVEDIAKEMGVEAVPVETTWATCVLDLQSNKTDLQFGLQATPKRALVIDFAGPAYNLYWYAVNHKGLKATPLGRITTSRKSRSRRCSARRMSSSCRRWRQRRPASS